jgi:hypothetical protein
MAARGFCALNYGMESQYDVPCGLAALFRFSASERVETAHSQGLRLFLVIFLSRLLLDTEYMLRRRPPNGDRLTLSGDSRVTCLPN